MAKKKKEQAVELPQPVPVSEGQKPLFDDGAPLPEEQPAISDVVQDKIEDMIESVPSYFNQETTDPHLFRVVDRDGDWTHYFQDEIKEYIPAVNHILAIGWAKGQGLMQWLKKMTEEEADRALKSAGERGAKVHSAIRDMVDGIKITIEHKYENDNGVYELLKADEWDCLMSWVAWVNVFKPKKADHEFSVWHKKFKYAGTIDFLGTIVLPVGAKVYIDDKLTTIKEEKRVKVLLDWKTSSAVHIDYKLQTAAYEATLPSRVDYTGVVRLGTRHQNGGYEIKLWSKAKTKYHFNRFVSTIEDFKFITGEETWEPKIEQIPLNLSVVIPTIPKRTPRKKKEKANV